MKTKTSLVFLLAGSIITIAGIYSDIYYSRQWSILKQENPSISELNIDNSLSQFHKCIGGMGLGILGLGAYSLYNNYKEDYLKE